MTVRYFVGRQLGTQPTKKRDKFTMQWKKVAAAIAVAAATSISGAAAASASLAPSAPKGHSTSAPVIKIVNLRQAYQHALPLAHHGRIMGKLQPRGKHVSPKAPHGPTTCVEPNCNLVYNGGSVQHHPHVYLLLWGPSWNPANSDTQYLSSFFQGIGVGPQDTWSTITSQYSDGSGHPVFSGSVLQGVYQDTTAPPSSVSQTNLTAEADAFVTNQGVTDLGNAQIVIASQSGTCFSDGFAGNSSGCGTPAGGYCAWHTNSGVGETFTNLPYQLDAGAGCGENFINSGSAGTYDGFSIVGGHEYAETITDPAPVSGWYDSADNVSGGEIGDKCAWAGEIWGTPDPAGNVTLSTGSFAMQSLWSNSASACVMSAPVSTPPVVTGISPTHGPTAGGTVVTVTGTDLTGGTVAFGANAATVVTCAATTCTATSPAGTGTVNVQVTTAAGTSATSSADQFTYANPPVVTGISPTHGPTTGGTIVTVTGTDLTAGTVAFGSKAATAVTCGATSCTATSPSGTGTVNVKVTNTAGTSATSSADKFTYTVPPPPSGAIVGYGGKCVMDEGPIARNGNLVGLWTCYHTGGQTWTVEPDSTLRVGGKCMTDLGTANARIDVVPCNGSWQQVWVHHSNGELVNPHTGKCLTDPWYRTANGTPLVLWSCANTANQHWRIP